MPTAFTQSFLDELHTQADWSKQDLLKLLRREFPDLTEATLIWRIHDLKQRGLLHLIGRGQYTTQAPKATFEPVITSGPLRLLQRVRASLPSGTPVCLSDTSWLAVLGDLTVSPTFILIETDKNQLETVLRALLELSRKVFLDPDASAVERYVRLHDRAVVLRPLVSEAPLTEAKGGTVSSLEKLLVDAVVQADLFADYQTHLPQIFKQAQANYALNVSRLRRYARRRDRLTEIESLL